MSAADGLRDEIIQVLISTGHDGYGPSSAVVAHVADAVLPVVQRHIDAAREQVAEQIAAALAAVPDEVYPEDVFAPPASDDYQQVHEALKAKGLPTLDRLSANIMRHAYRQAARIAREHSEGDG